MDPAVALFHRNNVPFEAHLNFIDSVARWQQRPAYISAIGNHMPGSMALPCERPRAWWHKETNDV